MTMNITLYDITVMKKNNLVVKIYVISEATSLLFLKRQTSYCTIIWPSKKTPISFNTIWTHYTNSFELFWEWPILPYPMLSMLYSTKTNGSLQECLELAD